ncbi:esterase-like activity of phytase family protein [Amycolatopsis suaedae]|uniref:Esterase-like activity of phytase family protein n=1 Tax=Amycolatopsis suaedae TaxID=2510978 RepID=A0A4Q7JEC1_9PSEU|nr:esterase-like activity of phytase family protein [Amycolatopsis suaedae]RZQ65033.1 esterase-like activity of phytase family protein [Amycolatopsis suaedae]
MPRRLTAAVLAGALALPLLATPAAADSGPRLLGERIVPNGLLFAGTEVGGLSSIDYDRRTGQYVLISDDRSDRQPARFYTARIPVTRDGIGTVEFTGTTPLLRPDGTTYPPLRANDPAAPQNAQTIDPEELRTDPLGGGYYWSQEGERSASALIDPSIREADRDGRYRRDLPIPDGERMTATTGPRQNYGIEGFTFAAGGVLVASALEGPLLQDGPEATPSYGPLSRITVQGRFGPVLAQYAYPQEPIFATPNPPTAFANTGVTSILAENTWDPSRFLVMERSFVTGVGNSVRIYEVDTRGATNVLRMPSLKDRKVTPVRKRLLVDLADVGLSTVDNIEGMTWGPRLPGGKRSLLLVSDNNFSATQVTQIIALAL